MALRTESFAPAWLLGHRHAQTIWPALFRRGGPPALASECWPTADGEGLDVIFKSEKPPIIAGFLKNKRMWPDFWEFDAPGETDTPTKPLVFRDGTIVRGLRVSFEGGRAVAVEATENAGAIRARTDVDPGAARLGELALVDRQGRIGPLDTVFYDTLLDENAASHIALGNGFPFLVDEPDASRVNKSSTHIDFMIGSNELEVTGVTAEGERVSVLRDGEWRL